MNRFPLSLRTITLLAVLVPLGAIFVHVVLHSGPLAPIPVTVITVEEKMLAPSLFGIGTVEARFVHHIGPTMAGRVRDITVHVGDRVHAGQLLGEMDPVDLDARLAAQDAAVQRAASTGRAAEAQVRELEAKTSYAQSQARRFEELARTGAVSKDSLEARQQEFQVARSGLAAAQASVATAKHDQDRLRSEGAGISRQRDTVRLFSPVDGLVTQRLAESGTTLVAGQTVVEIIDPTTLWINARFDQLRASGLRAGLSARITLRSQADTALAGQVLRLEPVADAVTEELLGKVVFDALPVPLPSLGELAEVTVSLPLLPNAPVIPNASVRRVGSQRGVWVVNGTDMSFAPITLGETDLDGRVQVREGLRPGQVIVVHSSTSLGPRSRIAIVDHLPGVPQ